MRAFFISTVKPQASRAPGHCRAPYNPSPSSSRLNGGGRGYRGVCWRPGRPPPRSGLLRKPRFWQKSLESPTGCGGERYAIKAGGLWPFRPTAPFPPPDEEISPLPLPDEKNTENCSDLGAGILTVRMLWQCKLNERPPQTPSMPLVHTALAGTHMTKSDFDFSYF